MKKILSFLLLLISIFAVGCTRKNPYPEDSNGALEFHTDLQKEYFGVDYALVSMYAKGKEELSRPLPIKLSFTREGSALDVGYTITIKEKETGKETVIISGNTSLEVYNLKAHTYYEWFVNGELEGEFTTVSGIRNLYIDGVTNVRDIGGYKVGDSYTKQGMLIRGAKLNSDDTGEVIITGKGIDALKQLGIKTELDLRDTEVDSDGNVEQGLISASAVYDVKYISFPMLSGGNYLQLNKDRLKDLFAILANEDNYPIYFHCSIGTDRTGVVAFLINALLGVSEEEIYRDYLFSNFGNINGSRSASTIKDYIKKVSLDRNKSLSENTKDYLISIGVSENDINKLINIMIDKK